MLLQTLKGLLVGGRYGPGVVEAAENWGLPYSDAGPTGAKSGWGEQRLPGD